VAVIDEGYQLDELAGDAGTAGKINTAITLNGKNSMTASFVSQCS
jgi:hypothetical protein